jgi:hypothetical protein
MNEPGFKSGEFRHLVRKEGFIFWGRGALNL